MATIAVIIVTHNSGQVLNSCLGALTAQTRSPDILCVVDSGSTDTEYLDGVRWNGRMVLLRPGENIGFSRGNNLGFHQVGGEADFILFLNPDVLLEPGFLDQAVSHMEGSEGMGVLTGCLSGYDFTLHRPSGLLDSTGIFRKWYGRWYDRGQGEADRGQFARGEDIPAACGALMFCRQKALVQSALPDGAVFDPAFFMYKEDIELCLRIRRRGWSIRYEPELRGFHGRGWQRRRGEMSFALRKMAARNELLLYARHPSPYFFWALAKYALVFLFRA